MQPAQVVSAPRTLTGCDDVRTEVSKYPDWDARLMVAISKAESNCRAEAKGDGHITFKQKGRVYGYSLSAMQVRILPGREHCDTHDLATNIKCAHDIFKGQGYKAWSVYTNGKYKKFL